jgi:hypothetical protein
MLWRAASSLDAVDPSTCAMSTCSTAVVNVTCWLPNSSVIASSEVTFSRRGSRAFNLSSMASSLFMMAASMASVVEVEPEPETVLMVAEAHLVS